jgi:hypothetical protein
MRSLWLLAAAIGAAVLIFAHASLVGVVIGVPLLRTCRRLAFEAVGRRTELDSWLILAHNPLPRDHPPLLRMGPEASEQG